jgi:hypothetical protein
MPRFALDGLLHELLSNSVGHKSETSVELMVSAEAENALKEGPVHEASGAKTISTKEGNCAGVPAPKQST